MSGEDGNRTRDLRRAKPLLSQRELLPRMELEGLEPSTFSLPDCCAPCCATAPFGPKDYSRFGDRTQKARPDGRGGPERTLSSRSFVPVHQVPTIYLGRMRPALPHVHAALHHSAGR